MDYVKLEPVSPVKVEWCQTFVLKLIEYWEENECLYDTKSPLYRNKNARSEALDVIAMKMQNLIPGVTQTDIKTKINYLRSQYGREILRLQNATKSGAGTDYLCQSSSYWFKSLGFLREFLSVRKGKCNPSYDLEDTSSESESIPSFSKRKKVEWCQTFVLKLIEYWKENECLYNSKSSLYRNKHARSEALDVIAMKMQNLIPGVTEMDIKTKINNLRSQYGRELLKLQNSTKSGTVTDDLYQPSSYWFKQLSFLKDFMSVRKDKFNFSYALEDSSSEAESAPSFSKRKKVNSINTYVTGETDNLSTDIPTADDALKKCLDVLQKLSETKQSEDDGTVNFFRLQLGEITNKDLKDEAICKIMLLLFEYKKKNRDLAT